MVEHLCSVDLQRRCELQQDEREVHSCVQTGQMPDLPSSLFLPPPIPQLCTVYWTQFCGPFHPPSSRPCREGDSERGAQHPPHNTTTLYAVRRNSWKPRHHRSLSRLGHGQLQLTPAPIVCVSFPRRNGLPSAEHGRTCNRMVAKTRTNAMLKTMDSLIDRLIDRLMV